MGSKGHMGSLDSCSMEMKSLMFVLIGLSVAYVKGVDILRMDERIYEGEEVEMMETEMDKGDTVEFEIDEDAACKSCCDPPVVDICGELAKKLDEIDMAGIGGSPDRKTLEDASNLLCSNNRNAKSIYSIADDVPVSSSLHDYVLLWGLLYQGYYQGAWGSRNFGFHPKVPLKPREKVGMFTRGGYRRLHQQHS